MDFIVVGRVCACEGAVHNVGLHEGEVGFAGADFDGLFGGVEGGVEGRAGGGRGELFVCCHVAGEDVDAGLSCNE